MNSYADLPPLTPAGDGGPAYPGINQTTRNAERASVYRAGNPDSFSAFTPQQLIKDDDPLPASGWQITGSHAVPGKGTVVDYEYELNTLKPGYRQAARLPGQYGTFKDGFNFDARAVDKVTFQTLTTQQVPASAVDPTFIAWCIWQGRVVLGIGDNTNYALWIEPASPTPALTGALLSPVTYSPDDGTGDYIQWMGPCTFSSGTYFLICRQNKPPEVWTAPGGTFIGDMNGNLSPCAGFVVMPVQTRPGSAQIIFITTSGTLFIMNTGDDWNTAPAYAGSVADAYSIPTHTHPVGMVQWGKQLRVFHQATDNPAGPGINVDDYDYPRDKAADLHERTVRAAHHNVDGLDWDEVKFTTLPRIECFEIWKDGLIATDGGANIEWKAGSGAHRILKLTEKLPLLTNRERKVRDFGPNGDECLILIDEVALSGSSATTSYLLALDWETWTLTPASKVTTLTGLTGIRSLASVGGGIPRGPVSHHVHRMAGGNFYRQFQAPVGATAWDFRGTVAFESSLEIDLSDITLPKPLCYSPSVADSVYFGGDIDAAGDGSTLTVDWGKYHEEGAVADTGSQGVFTAPVNRKSRTAPHNANSAPFSKIEGAKITATRAGTDATQTVQLLPITLTAHAFIPAKVTPPEWVE